MKNTKQIENEAVLQIAGFMAAASRTAPKAKGMDNISTMVLHRKKDKDRLIKEMLKIAKKENKPGFERDAENIKKSTALLLIGTRLKAIGLTYCSFCGFKDCQTMQKSKGTCAYNNIDLGIAVGSAVSIAADFRIDNRIMYSAGKTAIKLNLFKERGVKIALGIPLSISGKSPFFDRK